MQKSQYDPAEVQRFLDQRQAERLTLKQLSDLSGIPIHVFTYRISRNKRAAPAAEQPAPGFLQIVPAPEPHPQSLTSNIELIFPCGTRAVLAPDFDESGLARLFSAARC